MDSFVVSFDEQSCSIDAVQRASYRLAALFTVDIRVHAAEFVCRLQPTSDEAEPEHLERAFRAEVLDQVLRERIRHETEPIRNAVLALAFSRVDLDEPTK